MNPPGKIARAKADKERKAQACCQEALTHTKLQFERRNVQRHYQPCFSYEIGNVQRYYKTCHRTLQSTPAEMEIPKEQGLMSQGGLGGPPLSPRTSATLATTRSTFVSQLRRSLFRRKGAAGDTRREGAGWVTADKCHHTYPYAAAGVGGQVKCSSARRPCLRTRGEHVRRRHKGQLRGW